MLLRRVDPLPAFVTDLSRRLAKIEESVRVLGTVAQCRTLGHVPLQGLPPLYEVRRPQKFTRKDENGGKVTTEEEVVVIDVHLCSRCGAVYWRDAQRS